jgi:hypothetical protein
MSEVFDGESPIDQCIEYLTLTGILKMKYGSIGLAHVELKMYP